MFFSCNPRTDTWVVRSDYITSPESYITVESYIRKKKQTLMSRRFFAYHNMYLSLYLSQETHAAEAYSSFSNTKGLEVLPLPLMPVHHKVVPPCISSTFPVNSPLSIYNCRWRKALWKLFALPKNTMQWLSLMVNPDISTWSPGHQPLGYPVSHKINTIIMVKFWVNKSTSYLFYNQPLQKVEMHMGKRGHDNWTINNSS